MVNRSWLSTLTIPIVAGYRRGFERDGWVVHAATTAAAAHRLAQRHRMRLAVVDLRIGSDWGIELIRHLKHAHPATHVVLVSGFLSVASTAVGAIHAGANDVVYKPITARQILRLLDDEPAVAGPRSPADAGRSAAGACCACSPSAAGTSPRPPASSACTARACSGSCAATRRGRSLINT